VCTVFLHCSLHGGSVGLLRPKWRPVRSSHDSPFLTFFFHKELLIYSFFPLLVTMLSNWVIKNRRNVTPLLTKRRIVNTEFIFTFRIVIPVKYSRYHRLNLPDCKVASKSELYGHYIVAGRTVYLSCNVYGNDLSVLCGVLDKKKRLDAKERETALLLRNTAFKLLRFKDR